MLSNMNIKNIKIKISVVLIVSILLSMLSSCAEVKVDNTQAASIKDFSYGEAMILVASEKNKYEDRFGTEIWNLKSGDGTKNFSDEVVSNVKQFVEKIHTINLMSEKYNISISKKDYELIDKLAEEYYSKLTDADKEFMTSTRENVYNVYVDFHKARLTIDHVTKNANIELSISEAKVIRVQYIEFEDYKTAYSVSTKSQARGANFAYFAKQYTKAKGNIERVVMRGDEFSTPFPEIYYLSTGQMSDILEHDGKYYIFKCLDDFMEEETANRKKEILKQLKEDAFNEEFILFEKEHAIHSNAAYWKEIDIKKGGRCKVNNFYDLYYSYFPMTNE